MPDQNWLLAVVPVLPTEPQFPTLLTGDDHSGGLGSGFGLEVAGGSGRREAAVGLWQHGLWFRAGADRGCAWGEVGGLGGGWFCALRSVGRNTRDRSFTAHSVLSVLGVLSSKCLSRSHAGLPAAKSGRQDSSCFHRHGSGLRSSKDFA